MDCPWAGSASATTTSPLATTALMPRTLSGMPISRVPTRSQERPSGETQATAPVVPSSSTAAPTATKPESVLARSMILSPRAKAPSSPGSTALQP